VKEGLRNSTGSTLKCSIDGTNTIKITWFDTITSPLKVFIKATNKPTAPTTDDTVTLQYFTGDTAYAFTGSSESYPLYYKSVTSSPLVYKTTYTTLDSTITDSLQ
jgi:hypothetical protein